MSDKRDWSIKVTRAENGYACEWWEEIENNVFSHRVHVVEEIDGKELECTRILLFFIKEFFAVYHSKHNKKNLFVEIR